MKAKFSHVFWCSSIVILGSWCSTPASAQSENDPPPVEIKDQNPESNLNDEKSLILEHDSRPVKVRDTVHVHSPSVSSSKTKSPEQAKPSTNKEEDALSFNFLYYIIQKFKISDLIDD